MSIRDARNAPANDGMWQAVTAAVVSDFAWTIGAEDSPNANERLITIQCLDINGRVYKGRTQVLVSIHSAQLGAVDGDTPIAALDGDTTGTLLVIHTAGLVETFLTDATGKLVIKISDAGNDTFYMRACVGGLVTESEAITFGSG